MSIESPISMEMFYINIGRQNSKQLRHLSAVFVIYHRGILLQQIQTPNQENCCTYLTRCFFVIFIFGFFFFSFLFSFSFFFFFSFFIMQISSVFVLVNLILISVLYYFHYYMQSDSKFQNIFKLIKPLQSQTKFSSAYRYYHKY